MWTAIAIAALAICLRAWIVAQPELGFFDDLDLFVRWVRGLAAHGLAGFYAAEDFCDYPPLMVLCFWAVGAIAASFDLLANDHLLVVLVKSMAILADLAIAALLFWEVKRLFGRFVAPVASGLYLLNPVAVYDSAYWGQLDAIYTAWVLAAVIGVANRRWALAGGAAALSVLAKFQSVAVLPIVLFEAFRLGGRRGLGRLALAATVTTLTVAIPFWATSTQQEVVSRAYVNVVGQYSTMSMNAYNVWTLAGLADLSDTGPPFTILRAVAAGRNVLETSDSWLLGLTWRRLSLAGYALVVAVILALYARRPGPVARYAAAGALALGFYLVPTEMHERYAFPAIALLVPWAAAAPRHERIYWGITIAVLLNLTSVMSPGPLAPQIAAANLVLFGLLIAGLSRLTPAAAPPLQPLEETSACPPVIRIFQRATGIAVALALIACVAVFAAGQRRSPPEASSGRWLAEEVPLAVEQGWRQPRRNRSVAGGVLEMAGRFYLRGIGTHAPATLVYTVPPGAAGFEAVVGVDRAANGRGSFTIDIEADGAVVYRSPRLTGGSDPIPISADVRGTSVMTLHLGDGGDGQHWDHANLALARFTY